MHISIKIFHKLVIIFCVLFHFITFGSSRTRNYKIEKNTKNKEDFFNNVSIITPAKNILYVIQSEGEIQNKDKIIRINDIKIKSSCFDMTILSDTYISPFLEDEKNLKDGDSAVDIIAHLLTLIHISYKNIDLMNNNNKKKEEEKEEEIKNLNYRKSLITSIMKNTKMFLSIPKQSFINSLNNKIKTESNFSFNKNINFIQYLLVSKNNKEINIKYGQIINNKILKKEEIKYKEEIQNKKKYNLTSEEIMNFFNGCVYFISLLGN